MIKRKRKVLLTVLLILVFSMILNLHVHAASFPVRPINLIVPWSAGGGTDLLARIIAKHLEKYLGQPIPVINIAGGGGSIAIAEVIDMKPDGYSLLFHHLAIHTLYESGISEYGWQDLEPIAQLNQSAAGLHVKADAPWKTIEDLRQDALERPGKITFAMSTGATAHFTGLLLEEKLGIDLALVDIGGGGPRAAALEGGHVDINWDTLATSYDYIESGKWRTIGMVSSKRSKFLPDIPTITEQGYDVVLESRYAMYGPPGLDEEAKAVLTEALIKLQEDEEYLKDKQKLYVEHVFVIGEELLETLKKEQLMIRELLKMM